MIKPQKTGNKKDAPMSIQEFLAKAVAWLALAIIIGMGMTAIVEMSSDFNEKHPIHNSKTSK